MLVFYIGIPWVFIALILILGVGVIDTLIQNIELIATILVNGFCFGMMGAFSFGENGTKGINKENVLSCISIVVLVMFFWFMVYYQLHYSGSKNVWLYEPFCFFPFPITYYIIGSLIASSLYIVCLQWGNKKIGMIMLIATIVIIAVYFNKIVILPRN